MKWYGYVVTFRGYSAEEEEFQFEMDLDTTDIFAVAAVFVKAAYSNQEEALEEWEEFKRTGDTSSLSFYSETSDPESNRGGEGDAEIALRGEEWYAGVAASEVGAANMFDEVIEYEEEESEWDESIEKAITFLVKG